MVDRIYCSETEEFDEDLNIDLKKIFMILLSRKDLIIRVFSCVLIFFVLLTFVTPKKYKVSADLYINKSNNTNLVEINPYAIEEMGAGGGMAALMSGASGGLINELEIIQSPLVMDKVVRDNDIKYKKKFGIIPNKREGEYVPGYLFAKSKGLSIENKKGTHVVSIEYKSGKPELAYNIVCSIIANYINVSKDLHSDKAKNDTQILQKEYDKVKADLNNKMEKVSGLPQTALGGTGNLAALSAISKSAGGALSSIQNQYSIGAKSQIAVEEESEKVKQLATKLEWAKMVEEMSDSSKVLILKEPQKLRDFEYASPKLSINIIIGILFGAILSIISVIISEIFDKKVSYSKLGDNIIYNSDDLFSEINQMLLENKDKNISCIIFNTPQSQIVELLATFKNLTLLKAEISEKLYDGINDSDAVILFVKIGVTEIKLYDKIKQSIQKKKKAIIDEVLI